MNRFCTTFLLGVLALAVPCGAQSGKTSPATEKVDGVFFERRIRPILEKSCLGCHGVDARLSGLDLRSSATALKGGTRGAVLVAGSAEKSLFYKLVTGARAPVMPPGGKLPPEQIALLKRWIDGGAPYSTAPLATATKQVWWSFRPLVKPPVPTLPGSSTVPAPPGPPLAPLGAVPAPPGLKPTPLGNARSSLRRGNRQATLPLRREERTSRGGRQGAVRHERSPRRGVQNTEGVGSETRNEWSAPGGAKTPRRSSATLAPPPPLAAGGGSEPTANRGRGQNAGRGQTGGRTGGQFPTAIDSFLLVKLREKGLTFAPPADKRTLIRRVTLDLIGLPPTPEEVRDFLADTRPDAYERVVERLLASPHYGERWGRHWLDLVRYADSGGFEGDKDRPLMWRYRDWVIDAFNDDLPYDQFVKDQLAGDELRPDDRHALIATGFLAAGPQDIVENNARTRANELDDLVATTGSVVLGLTIGCARCHDHKYDPVKMTDYYRLSAVFAPTQRKEVDVPTPDERQFAAARAAEVDREQAPLRQRAEPLRKKGEAAAKKAGQANPTEEQIVAALAEPERGQLKALLDQLRALDSKRIALPKAQAVVDAGRTFPAQHVLLRGDAYHPGDTVKAGFICALPGGAVDIGEAPAGAATTGRRTALANWLVSKENPLTARVWVNRVWRQHFGRGIVNTPSNFGINGELPSHPELLDWLAATFVDEGYRLKPLHRRIVLSQAYRQGSQRTPQKDAIDPENRLYGRQPVRRLEAEAIRDSILAVAGTLNTERGGPPVYPPVDPTLRADTFQGMNWPEGEDSPKTWRRSVYVKVKRSLLLPQLEVFDCPEITYTVAARNVTTTPLQALLLLNDPLIRRQAALFAERLQRDRPGDSWAQVERAYQLCFCRPPTVAERRLGLAFLKTRSVADYCQALLNLNEFVYVP